MCCWGLALKCYQTSMKSGLVFVYVYYILSIIDLLDRHSTLEVAANGDVFFYVTFLLT